MMIFNVFAIALGGFVGAVLRYMLSTRLNSGSFVPLGTLLSNSIGCFIIGFVFALEIPLPLTFLLVSGLSGALTTFSTWMKELLEMMQTNEWGKSTLYFVGTLIGAVGFVYIGHTLGMFIGN